MDEVSFRIIGGTITQSEYENLDDDKKPERLSEDGVPNANLYRTKCIKNLL